MSMTGKPISILHFNDAKINAGKARVLTITDAIKIV